jgi:hypothetical protein
MEAETVLKISVILPAVKGLDSVRAAVHAWHRQSRDDMEIVIACPTATPEQIAALPGAPVVVQTGALNLHQARLAAIRRSSGEFIMLAEDHCLPDADWADAMLARLTADWDAVGCALRPGNRGNLWARASFLIGYAEWMMPQGGPARVLCGWNVVVRRSLLDALRTDLEELLLVGAFIIRRLQSQGARFYLEPRARMRHFDPSGFVYEMFLVGLIGVGFGALRTRSWPRAARLLYPLGAPLIGLLHAKRAVKQYYRARGTAGLGLSALLGSCVLAAAWGFGEGVGALVGVAHVRAHLWRTDVKPVSEALVAESDALEGRQPTNEPIVTP